MIPSISMLTFPDFEQHCIIETDPSSVADGAIISQKKEDGKLHAVQFASRTMDNFERSYSACEKEALAVKLALKKFRAYLLSPQPFKLIIDHHTLKYALKKNENHVNVEKWMDFLA